jgi:hypothetical protein
MEREESNSGEDETQPRGLAILVGCSSCSSRRATGTPGSSSQSGRTVIILL